MTMKPLLDAANLLDEAQDFCEAVFMAAAGLQDSGETAVFQRIAEEARRRIQKAQDTINEMLAERRRGHE